MSGKKGKLPKELPLLRYCSKCETKVLYSAWDEHVANPSAPKCNEVFPSISKSALAIKLSKFPSGAKFQNNPLYLRRQAEFMMFLPEEIMREMEFSTHGWVGVSTQENCKNEIAFRAWPLVTQDFAALPRSEYLKAFLTSNGHISHPSFKVGRTIYIRILSGEKTCAVYPVYPTVKSLFIETSFEYPGKEEKLLDIIKMSMLDRLVDVGNEFSVKFFAEVVKFTVKEIQKQPADTTIHTFPDFDHAEINIKSKILRVVRKQDESKMKSEDEIELFDIGGAVYVIKELQTSIKLVLENPGPKELRGILLYGHHGTGKSWLARGICNNFKLHMILYQNPPLPQFIQNDRRTVCKSLQEAFTEAVKRAPSAIIIDDLDVADMGDEGDFTSSPTFVASLKAQFERLDALRAQVIVLATTADLDSVDPGLRSPALFARELEVPIPTALGRQDILNRIMKKMKHKIEGKELKQIAENTHGFVGADLRALCHESALRALRDRKDSFFNLQDLENSLKSVRPSAMKGYTIEVPNVKWSDIGGQEDLKFKLKQAIEWPIKHPEAFTRMGITPPKGFLMYGPPGCSKTMIAKAIATESGLNFISVKGSEIFSKWVGESEKAIQSLFRKAREVAPSILFFDEIDSMGGERGNSSSGGSSVNERVLSQLLVEIDGIESLRDVTIVAATNRPDMIDLALIRPGRLDRIIYVPLPDAATRKDIFQIRFKKMPVDTSVDLNMLVNLTEGYSGAEITSFCQEAALKALEQDINSALIRESHFLQALNIVKPRISKEQIDFYENYSKTRSMS